MDILRNKKTPLLLLSTIILPILFTTPANADYLPPEELNKQISLLEDNKSQHLDFTNYTSPSEPIQAETFEEVVEPPPVVTPQPATVSYSGQAVLTGYSSLLDAARAQIGINQDCTALVENALRAIGINVGDMAPMSFAGLGTQISPDQAQAGDIMMRGGHVTIYAGNGVAIHGGFNGSTVETTYDANPYNYSVIVRL